MGRQIEKNDFAEPESIGKSQEKTKKLKWRILIICAVMGALLVSVALLAIWLGGQEEKPPQYDYEFYPTYQGNIMENEDYLELNRELHYCADANGYGMTELVKEGTLEDFDPAVRFLYGYVQAILSGDAVSYNSFFSDDYLERNGEQPSFSPQMVYDAYLRFYKRETDSKGNVTVIYTLEYCIYQNDGTFRRDIGSDMSRLQYLILKESPNGNFKIENIVTYHVGEIVNQ